MRSSAMNKRIVRGAFSEAESTHGNLRGIEGPTSHLQRSQSGE